MLFVPRRGRVYRCALSVPERLRYVVTVAVMVTLVLIWLYGVHFPLKNSINHSSAEVNQLHKQLRQMQEVEREQSSLNQLVSSMHEKVNSYRSSGDPSNDLQARLSFVLDAVHAAGLTLRGYTTRNAVANKGWYTKKKARLDFTGRLEQIMSFLNSMKNSRKMIRVKNVSLERTDENLFRASTDISYMILDEKSPST